MKYNLIELFKEYKVKPKLLQKSFPSIYKEVHSEKEGPNKKQSMLQLNALLQLQAAQAHVTREFKAACAASNKGYRGF